MSRALAEQEVASKENALRRAEVSVSVCFLRCVVWNCEFIALTVMSLLYMDKLSRVYERYQEYVRTNPAAASHLESTVRALSYLIAGETLNVCQSESKHTLSRLMKQCRARLKLDVCLFSYCSLSAVVCIVLLRSVFGSLFFFISKTLKFIKCMWDA